MHAEQWMELAVNGRASRELIPMGFQPTLPELYRGADGWRVRFFFYGMRLRDEEPALETPAYRLEFSLASGRPVSFDALAGAGKPLDGGGCSAGPPTGGASADLSLRAGAGAARSGGRRRGPLPPVAGGLPRAAGRRFGAFDPYRT